LLPTTTSLIPLLPWAAAVAVAAVAVYTGPQECECLRGNQVLNFPLRLDRLGLPRCAGYSRAIRKVRLVRGVLLHVAASGWERRKKTKERKQKMKEYGSCCCGGGGCWIHFRCMWRQ